MPSKETSLRQRMLQFLHSPWAVSLLLLLALAVRLLYAWVNGLHIMIVSDSTHYYNSGLEFAKTGRITYQGCTTALIMPGTTVLLGLLAMVFPEGEALMWAIQLCFVLIGTITPYFMYKAAAVFLPKPWALLAFVPYLLPAYAGISNYLLTEVPFYLFFAMALYGLFMMGERQELRWAVLFGVSVLGALLFRANILMFAGFGLLWIVIRGNHSWKEVFKRVLLVGGILLLFLLPWTVRNYVHFQDFIPVTYGLGNPVMEGTYYGDCCPIEDRLDINIPHQQFREQYADYLDEAGQPLDPDQGEYLHHMLVKRIGDYRLGEWFRQEPLHFLKTYLYAKPRLILNWNWYYHEFMGLSYAAMHSLRLVNFALCAAAVLLAFVRKRFRKLVVFLTGAYFVSLLSVAYALPIDRYAESIMPYRFMLACIGAYLLAELARCMLRRGKKEERI